ncbi:hypothetical protein ACFQJ7_07280 [Halovenus rubra]|uniref:Restriction endonuclease n=2 Tax=Halovenus rubra TaxID=869890 RepID=A0ABD5X7P0_9EURY|nr:hypothetical protein [Halovenus rubra]
MSVSIDDILDPSFEGNGPGLEDQLDELEEAGLGSKVPVTLIECTSREDDDFEIAEIEGCDRAIEVTEAQQDAGIVSCDCGRQIDLSKKRPKTQFRFKTDFDEVRNYIQSESKKIESIFSAQKKSLTYLGYRFNGQVLRIKRQGFRDREPIQDTVDVHLCTTRLPEPVVKTIKLYRRQAFFVLVGNGVGNRNYMEQLNLPFIEFGELYQMESDAQIEKLQDLIESACHIGELTDLDTRARIAAQLYENHREEVGDIDRINEDVFEYIVNTLFNYCFRTSQLFGTTESGLEFPDGTLCLQVDGTGRLYLWDAKYSIPEKEPYDLSASDQRNMTKYPRLIRENSEMIEEDFPIDSFAGFIFISPRMDASDLEGFASKLAEQYSDASYMNGAPIIQIRADALIELYRAVRDNKSEAKKIQQTLRLEFNRLLQQDTDHISETEFREYHEEKHDDMEPENWPSLGSTEITLFDVTVDDVERLFEDALAKKSPPQVGLDSESLRETMRRLDK